jgi:hypothetical protein
VSSYFCVLRDDIVKRFEEHQKGHGISGKEISKFVDDVVEQHYQAWQKAKTVPGLPSSHASLLRKHYSKEVLSIQKTVFERLPVSLSTRRKLLWIAAHLFTKFPQGVAHTGMSGVVFAGFGRNETFPALRSYIMDGMTLNRVKYSNHTETSIGMNADASVTPFAQSDAVETFMEGVAPDYRSALLADFRKLLKDLTDLIISSVPNASKKGMARLDASLTKANHGLLQKYRNGLDKYSEEHYWKPVVQVVGMLPKDELAAMAETLINLTSFKRRMSMEAETVGGPIDVALISKGDGLIWVKRKHYFRRDLNPHFFGNYLEGDDND